LYEREFVNICLVDGLQQKGIYCKWILRKTKKPGR
jgi:hypothetical protein